jgi:hypothetical protein
VYRGDVGASPPMTDHYLTLAGGVTARLSTRAPLDERLRRDLASHLPGLSFSSGAPAHVDIEVHHIESDTPRLLIEGNRVALHAPAAAVTPEDLHHLLWGVLRRALLDRDLYSVHSACVGGGAHHALLVGHSGAGKTTLARRLTGEHGLKLFSGNKTVIRLAAGKLWGIAGTHTVTALTRDLDGAYRRHSFDLPAAEVSPEEEVEVSAIFLVRINDGVQEDQRLSDLGALHTLYPFFLDSMNADVIVNGVDVFNGAPQQQVKQRLVQRLGPALCSVPVRRIAGDLAFLARSVIER